MNLYANGGTYWDHYTLDWLFETLCGWYDSVPQGEYKYDLYIEGLYAGGTTFTVIE